MLEQRANNKLQILFFLFSSTCVYTLMCAFSLSLFIFTNEPTKKDNTQFEEKAIHICVYILSFFFPLNITHTWTHLITQAEFKCCRLLKIFIFLHFYSSPLLLYQIDGLRHIRPRAFLMSRHTRPINEQAHSSSRILMSEKFVSIRHFDLDQYN